MAGGYRLPTLAVDRDRMCEPDSGDVVRGRYGMGGGDDHEGETGEMGSVERRAYGLRKLFSESEAERGDRGVGDAKVRDEL